jgi:uncharacterized membrane protein HdeD (DUF308 family)
MVDVRPAAPTPGRSLGSALEGLRHRWGLVTGVGVLFVIFGLIALGSVVTATVASVWMVGLMMLLSGGVEVAHGFAVRSWGRSTLWILLGLLYGLAGVFAIMNPIPTAGVLTLLLGAGLVASGIVRIVLAFQMKGGTPWGWVAISGAITALLGAAILAQWPLSSLWVLGMFLGIDLVFAGLGWIMMGFALRRLP